MLADRRDIVHFSLALAWEIAIKAALGRFDALTPETVESRLQQRLDAEGFVVLPIRLAHIGRVAQLPPIHGDLFERMLVAQAQVEGLTIVTHDAHIRRHRVNTLS